MNLDWIVAIVTFLTLVTFSFNYYTAFFVYQADLDQAALSISERVLDSMTAEGSSMPVYFNASAPENGKLLYINFPGSAEEMNSAAITLAGVAQPCMFSGSDLYWESDVVEGPNVFRLSYSKEGAGLNCDSPLTLGGEEEATPWAAEDVQTLSSGRLAEIQAMGYDNYRSSISVSRDLRIEAGGFVFGPLPPQSTNVYAFRNNVTMAGTGEQVSVRIMVW